MIDTNSSLKELMVHKRSSALTVIRYLAFSLLLTTGSPAESGVEWPAQWVSHFQCVMLEPNTRYVRIVCNEWQELVFNPPTAEVPA